MGFAQKLASAQQLSGALQGGTNSYGKPGGLPPPGAPYGQQQQPAMYGQQKPSTYPGQSQPYGQPQQPYGQPAAGAGYGSVSVIQPQQQANQGYCSVPAHGAVPHQHPQGQPTPYGQPSPYGQPGTSPYSPQPPYPGQQAYGQQQGAPYGQQQQQGYGQPPQAYPGAPPMQGSIGSGDQQIITELLHQCVRDQKLQAFYAQPGSVEQLAARVTQSGALNRLMSEWRLVKEIAMDCVKLALFDIILYIDDSGSMRFEENGERINDLKVILGRIAFAASLFDLDGISVRFMNSEERGDQITSEQQAAALIDRISFSGLTPLGTSLDKKILQPMVLQPAMSRQLRKPVLIMTITDGAPAGENRLHIVQVIQNAVNQLRNTQYGPDTISFQFAQVGNDMGAANFLQELDANPQIGSLIDCTSNYELEADQAKRNQNMDMSPEMWLVKLLLGPIDSSYDMKDERRQY